MWHQLGERIYKHFDSREFKWTSIDPVRFSEGEKESGLLFLWVGVMRGTLSPDDAKDAAVRCKEILLEYDIVDVEIAFRESIFTQFAAPQLLDHVSSVNPTADVRGQFTPALGLPIAPRPFLTSKEPAVSISAKAAGAIGSSSFLPAMLFSRPANISTRTGW